MMTGGLLFTATLSAIFATVICYWLGWKKVSIIVSAQFAFAFLVTSTMSLFFGREAAEPQSLLACALGSAAFPAMFLIYRVLFGPLDRRTPGLDGVAPPERKSYQPPSTSHTNKDVDPSYRRAANEKRR